MRAESARSGLFRPASRISPVLIHLVLVQLRWVAAERRLVPLHVGGPVGDEAAAERVHPVHVTLPRGAGERAEEAVELAVQGRGRAMILEVLLQPARATAPDGHLRGAARAVEDAQVADARLDLLPKRVELGFGVEQDGVRIGGWLECRGLGGWSLGDGRGDHFCDRRGRRH